MGKLFKLLIVFILFFICTVGYFEKSDLIKGYGLYLVQSESMSPKINKGDLLFSKKGEKYGVGDVVTFIYPYDINKLISHRVLGVVYEDGVYGPSVFYKTKGDANFLEDPWKIKASSIKGRVYFSIPFLGYLLFLIRNPIGYLFLILGFSILIISESNDLFLETLGWYKLFYKRSGIKLIKLKFWYKSVLEKVF